MSEAVTLDRAATEALEATREIILVKDPDLYTTVRPKTPGQRNSTRTTRS